MKVRASETVLESQPNSIDLPEWPNIIRRTSLQKCSCEQVGSVGEGAAAIDRKP